jgi:hypothetical protein
VTSPRSTPSSRAPPESRPAVSVQPATEPYTNSGKYYKATNSPDRPNDDTASSQLCESPEPANLDDRVHPIKRITIGTQPENGSDEAFKGCVGCRRVDMNGGPSVERIEFPYSSLTRTDHLECVWVPNWSSTAVTCGISGQWPLGMIVGRGGTTAVSNLPTSHGLAGTAGPQRPIKERGNPRAAPRSHRVTPGTVALR